MASTETPLFNWTGWEISLEVRYIACRRLVDLRDKENTQTGIYLKSYEKIVQGEEAVVDGVGML
jgi:hypothetical protein